MNIFEPTPIQMQAMAKGWAGGNSDDISRSASIQNCWLPVVASFIACKVKFWILLRRDFLSSFEGLACRDEWP